MSIDLKADHWFEPEDESERRLMNKEQFALEIALQLYHLRENRNLTQTDLAALVGTRQQVISRWENPAYDKHSLGALCKVAEQLNAYVDVVFVPDEKYDEYMEHRYRPALMETPPALAKEAFKEVEEWKQTITQTINNLELRVEQVERAVNNLNSNPPSYKPIGHYVLQKAA